MTIRSFRPSAYLAALFVAAAMLVAAPVAIAANDGVSPEETCQQAGMDYDGVACVERAPSKATIEKRAKANCAELGMAYRNGQCVAKTKKARAKANKKKNKKCPAGMYRNPLGVCQPNETGA